MKNKLKYLTITILFLLTFFIAPKCFADEKPKIDQFKEYINYAYENYIMYDYVDVTNTTGEMELIIVQGVYNDQLSLSIFYQPYKDIYGTTIEISKNNEAVNYSFYRGYELYNYHYDEDDNVVINVLDNNDSKYVIIYEIEYSMNEIKQNGIQGEGSGNFPDSTVTNESTSLKGCLVMTIITGIFIIGILIIVIAVMIATKNIHIKREKRITNYYVPRTNYYQPNQTNNLNNQVNENIIDVNDTVIQEEPKKELSEEEELKRLYSLRARGEITEEELNILLRKYRGKRDDD